MIRQQRDTTWPFLCILLALFVLSAVSPRAWERLARREAVAEVAAESTAADAPEAIGPLYVACVPPLEIPTVEPLFETADRAAADDTVEPPQLGQPGVLTEIPSASSVAQPSIEYLPPLDAGAKRGPIVPKVDATPAEPALPRTAAADSSNTVRKWPEPKALYDYLNELGSDGPAGKWATEVARRVRELGAAYAARSADTPDILRQLGALSEQVESLATRINDATLARKLRQAGHALSRRLAVWELVVKIAQRLPSVADTLRPDTERLAACLADIDALTRRAPEGKAWREYLMLSTLQEHCRKDRAEGCGLPRETAEEVLRRLTVNSMSPQQKRFVAVGPMAALTTELRRLTAEPVEPAALLEHLESYEAGRMPSDSRLLADDLHSFGVGGAKEQRRLSQELDSHYRNANMRFAISAELLNRLIPPQPVEYAPVRDTVLGLPVRGASMTSSAVTVRLLPDPVRARMALEMSGEVASATSSTSGPATFYSRGRATILATKPVVLDLKGVHLEPSTVEVHNEMWLRNLESDFDGIPLLGSLVRSIARSEHDQAKPAANREVRAKVQAKAQERIDAETGARLGDFSKRLEQRVLNPLYAMALDPTMIAAETTEHRILMRLRLAGQDQLGSHTPRPQAPANSLASLQVHESAINNALQRLKLEGRTFTPDELSEHLAAKLHRAEPWESDPDQDDVSITFAARNAVEVRCQNGQVLLTVAIAKLAKGRQSWRDFQVRVAYAPRTVDRSAELHREGIVNLDGAQLSATSQIALRGIFAKVFSKSATLNLTPDRLAAARELNDLEVSQFSIDDGWIGVALGPKRNADRVAKRP